MKTLIKTLLIASLPLGASTIGTKADGFDPRQPCHIILENADQATLAMVGAWTFGYLASMQSDPRPVSDENITTILRNINTSCADKKPISLLELVAGNGKTSADKPGSEAQARALLMKFF